MKARLCFLCCLAKMSKSYNKKDRFFLPVTVLQQLFVTRASEILNA